MLLHQEAVHFHHFQEVLLHQEEVHFHHQEEEHHLHHQEAVHFHHQEEEHRLHHQEEDSLHLEAVLDLPVQVDNLEHKDCLRNLLDLAVH